MKRILIMMLVTLMAVSLMGCMAERSTETAAPPLGEASLGV